MIMPEKVILPKYSQPVFQAQQVLQYEGLAAEKLKLSLYALMERAGSAVFAQWRLRWPNHRSVSVLCGKGNNGGDGFVVARLAHLAGLSVTTYLFTNEKKLTDPAKQAYQALCAVGGNIMVINQVNELNLQSDVVIDALFGIGFYGQLSAQMILIINKINCFQGKVISVDIPSGLSATTAVVTTTAIKADLTVSFIVYKQGLLTGMALDYVGDLVLCDLNIGQVFIALTRQYEQGPKVLLQGQVDLPRLAKRSHYCHKGDIGSILAIGGNIGMPGAIRLAAEAALRSGVSLVKVSCQAENHSIVLNGRPEIMLAPSEPKKLLLAPALKKAGVLLIGPGLGRDTWAEEMFNLTLNHSINQQKFTILDADALYWLSKNHCHNPYWVLTPHIGEAARLLACDVASIEADRFSAVAAIVAKYGGICVLKGPGTLVSNGRSTWIMPVGNAGMASGGMGDVLSGVIAALLLQMPNTFEAVRLAVYYHSLAADTIANQEGQRGMLASDLFFELQQLVN